MWAPGIQAGWHPKQEALKFLPNAICRKKYAMCDIVGFVVYPSKADAQADTNIISSAGTAKEAWEKALSKVAVFDIHTNEYILKEEK